MTSSTANNDVYRDQLTRWARALAAARDEAVQNVLAPGSTPEQVRMFVEDNVGKRLEKLQKQLEFTAAAFDAFDELLRSYTSAFPLTAYATAESDGERFLDWLERTGRLTPEQRDHVACQRARQAVEDAARRNRLGHVRFQELWSSADRLAEELGANPDLRVHLNPIRVRSRFVTTALLDDEASPPVDVLFFPVRNEISTAALERRGRALLKRLEASAPCTTSEWLHCNPRVGREEFLSFCRDLAEIGLAAFG